jgi:hypothetical protein
MGRIINIANGALAAVLMAQGIMILSTEPGLEILGAGLIYLSTLVVLPYWSDQRAWTMLRLS